jgi:hypothetical protein
MRKVEFDSFLNSLNCITHGKLTGYFIQWAQSFTWDDDNKKIPLTVALVELENGQVYMVIPNTMTFVD